MKQDQFIARFAADWQAFEDWLEWEALPPRARRSKTKPFAGDEFPQRYRQLCAHLALARSRDYGPGVVDRLARLAHRGHDLLYRSESGWLRRALAFLGGDFAHQVRAQWRPMLAAALLFYGPYLALMLAVRAWPDFAYVVLPDAMLDKFDDMYGADAQALGRARDAGDDVTMFGYYIFNNIGIGFRCFASGLVFGLGSIAALLYNGIFMGVIEAHVVNLGHAERFYSFVAGHSSFELTAIVLCGGSGLRLGWALFAPGGRSRGAALRDAARSVVGIVGGAAAMLLLAAAIEAFWSPRQLPATLKYAVGGAGWVLVLGYLLLAGRQRGS